MNQRETHNVFGTHQQKGMNIPCLRCMLYFHTIYLAIQVSSLKHELIQSNLVQNCNNNSLSLQLLNITESIDLVAASSLCYNPSPKRI